MIRELLRALASLRLTVALLVMALVLIFVGTLAQVRLGVWEAVATYFRAPIAWVDPGLLLPGLEVPPALRIPIPGGLAIGLAMIANLLAAHALKFRLVASRAGIVLLHAGLIVLLVGEAITGFFSREGLMRIDVGGSASFVEDVRSVELAVIDQTATEKDRVISIPGGMLAKAAGTGERLRDASLPFEVEVGEWHANAQLLRASGKTPATHGIGLGARIDPLPQARGVEGGASDAPAAYVTLHRDGAPIGTWLVSADLIDAQPVATASATYGIALRFTRTYKPYKLHLLEFRHDKFTGTEVARNFSSRVRLVDASHGTDREVVIWMNNPLRYAGDTFYQASYKPDGSGTVLQVVHNPGAWLPYVASGMIGIGMTVHFLLMLVGYLKRERARVSVVAPAGPGRIALRPAFPLLVGGFGLLLASQGAFRPGAQQAFDFDSFGVLPVSAGGRIKPVDTAARSLLTVVGGRQSIRTESGTMSATQFLLELIAKPESARELALVRVDHPDVLALMDLRPEDAGRLRLSTIEEHWSEIAEQAQFASNVAPPSRDSFQRGVLALYDRVQLLLEHAAMQQPYGIPPAGPDAEWASFAETFDPNQEITKAHPAVAFQVAMLTAYRAGDAPRFNRALASYRALVERDMPELVTRGRIEMLFNRARPFVGAMTVYTIAFLVLCAGFMATRGPASGWAERLRSAGVALLWAGFIVHTIAIVARIWLQGRPPVTNLYSSAIFVGWAAVLFGLIMEHINRLGAAALGSAAIGFGTLVVAHNLGTDGDTMQMMQAVLDSNFWLATHVVTITLGYSATFLAGGLATIYLLRAAFGWQTTSDGARGLARMVYGSVCFALLLSFVGTVLGGIWADQSWGRFWGWDPKENGAALVVLINAIILHARWGGMIRERGIMALAVFGNIVTAWSWFGTNMLGVGLHSYGFMDSAFVAMVAFVITQLGIMALAWRIPVVARAQE